VRRALERASPTPRLGAVLAAIATLTAALSPTWQREATVGGGAMIAVALVLAALSVGLRAAEAPSELAPRAWMGLGRLAGAALAESPPAALAIAAMTTALVLARRFDPASSSARLPAPRVFVAATVFGLAIAALLAAPLALRPLAPRAF